ncbi:hypothetical protein QLT09_10195 [Streptococcus equi subsp. zooepidemicus]|uniref:Uncharacterized protein n=1 Tax=Streptococcus equi subsp. zooepidemicus (strain MGCS10565) TaxID=552526 RepID=B4U3W9_STREM|nr:hypothetical protein [Streptococcus equi]ACG62686.1 hypothetical protein Sez_1350 [Streptococcus equi subsp. zooepidemicus MGCS10565]MDI5915036.1 hypothetical protein [Streptococcus equi subsp. zooepidemicus]MDI5919046.1 hypothetical protein [Streptococcus equi subsp. zooepidemicus]MDI5957142.1 hypothetical protein [Streptococcus equi subsp. zooepidemicus]MDI6036607.1 hypothetical protein [Streptococcus equi subsp. zooepidemicus]
MNWNLLDLCLFDGGNDLVGLEVNGRSLGFFGRLIAAASSLIS